MKLNHNETHLINELRARERESVYSPRSAPVQSRSIARKIAPYASLARFTKHQNNGNDEVRLIFSSNFLPLDSGMPSFDLKQNMDRN